MLASSIVRKCRSQTFDRDAFVNYKQCDWTIHNWDHVVSRESRWARDRNSSNRFFIQHHAWRREVAMKSYLKALAIARISIYISILIEEFYAENLPKIWKLHVQRCNGTGCISCAFKCSLTSWWDSWTRRYQLLISPSDAGEMERLYPFEFYLAPATHARHVSEITRGANSDGFPVLSRLIRLTSLSEPRRNGQNGQFPNAIK